MSDYQLIFARKKKKLTQAQLADKLGLSRNTIVNIENGRHRSNKELMTAIYKAVGLDYKDAYFNEEETDNN